jgi:uncharacterized protein YegL
MSISASPGAGAVTSARSLVEGFLIDCSGSMEGEKVRSAPSAVETAIDLLREDARFFVVAGSDTAHLVFPLAQATRENKQRARAAVHKLTAAGGTAMSTWLRVALQEFRKAPSTIHHPLPTKTARVVKG